MSRVRLFPRTRSGRATTFVIDSTDGPNSNGEYKIIAKDMLKLADGDRAQAPVLSNGFLQAIILLEVDHSSFTRWASAMTNIHASGYVAIGGKEIVAFTRVADAMTITRAQFNTEAQDHAAGDRAQLVKVYTANSPDIIINDLLGEFCRCQSILHYPSKLGG